MGQLAGQPAQFAELSRHLVEAVEPGQHPETDAGRQRQLLPGLGQFGGHGGRDRAGRNGEARPDDEGGGDQQAEERLGPGLSRSGVVIDRFSSMLGCLYQGGIGLAIGLVQPFQRRRQR